MIGSAPHHHRWRRFKSKQNRQHTRWQTRASAALERPGRRGAANRPLLLFLLLLLPLCVYSSCKLNSILVFSPSTAPPTPHLRPPHPLHHNQTSCDAAAKCQPPSDTRSVPPPLLDRFQVGRCTRPTCASQAIGQDFEPSGTPASGSIRRIHLSSRILFQLKGCPKRLGIEAAKGRRRRLLLLLVLLR